MESIIDILAQGRDREAQASKIYGFVIGIVTNNQDPDGLCRVKVKFPWLSEDVESWWARCSQPMAGAGRGTMCIPEVEDEVLIGFEHGDVRFPYVVGALYNGADAPPTANDVTSKFGGTEYDHGGHNLVEVNKDNENMIRMFKSKAGSLVLFDDTPDAERIVICDATGKRRIEFHSKGDSDNRVVITNEVGDMEFITEKRMVIRCEDLEIHARNDGKIEIDNNLKITVGVNTDFDTGSEMSQTSGANFKIDAGANLNQTAAANVTIDGIAIAITGSGTAEMSSPMSTLDGSATCIVKGGVVMIN